MTALRTILVAACVAFGAVSCVVATSDALSQALTRLTFLNSGVSTASDHVAARGIPCNYLEPDNVTAVRHSWAQTGTCQYPVPASDVPRPSNCTTITPTPNTDLPGQDKGNLVLPSNNATACQTACCADDGCAAWVFGVAPGDFLSCKTGDYCCYLKSGVPQPVARSGLVSAVAPMSPVGNTASGIRSAVPLGGIGGGVVELRGDGSFHEWMTQNQSPGGAAKIPVYDHALTAVKVGTRAAKALRTHPPPGVDGVAALRYQGAHPVSRLDVVNDTTWPDVDVSLFAFATLRAGDMHTSARPAATLAFTVTNRGTTAVPFTAMATLPTNLEPDTARAFQPAVAAVTTDATPSACAASCRTHTSCASWSVYAANASCVLYSNVPLNTYAAGVTSGVLADWTTSSTCLTAHRNGTWPTSGTTSLCAAPAGADGAGTSVTFGAADTVADLWSSFAASGTLPAVGTGLVGAVAVASDAVAPGDTATVTLTLAWYHPNFDFVGANLGRYYTTLWAGGEDVAAEAATSAVTTLQDIHDLHDVFFNSSLPQWMADFTVQTMSHVRSAMWLKDGRWRQWEAFDCVDWDSVHNDGERHIPYITLMPNATRSKLKAWANTQLANGMIQEELTGGCLGAVPPGADSGAGRVMGDVSSMFIQYVYELWVWEGDTNTLKTYWPTVKKAALWQNTTAAKYGVPEKLQTTYDILGLQGFATNTYNAFFHLMSMKAASRLATAMGDTAFAAACNASFARGQDGLKHLLWHSADAASNYSFWVGYNSDGKATSQYGIMSDALYAQVLAFSSGLGLLVDADSLKSHLAAVEHYTATKYGLTIWGQPFGAPNRNTGDQIWQMAPSNHATLGIRSGVMSVQDALVWPNRSISLWRDVLHDQWNVAGVASAQGLPSVTSHYGYAFTVWHTVMALSGQFVDVPAGIMTFDPQVTAPGSSTDFRLPIILPARVGTVERTGGVCTVTLVASPKPLHLTTLQVGGSKYPGAVVLTARQPVQWQC